MTTQERKLEAANSKLMLYESIVAEYYQAQRTAAPPPTAAKQQFAAYALEHEEQPKGQWGQPNDQKVSSTFVDAKNSPDKNTSDNYKFSNSDEGIETPMREKEANGESLLSTAKAVC